jgi:hypothetical protein
MSKHLNSKTRILGVCQLQNRLARQNYLSAERDIARMEMSREHLRKMVGEMLENEEVLRSSLLASRMELGHRLIAIDGRQKDKLMQDRQAAAALQSKVFLSARREDRAAMDLKQARKSSVHRQQQNQPCSVRSHPAAKRQWREGRTS